jgi:hypothetical protein
MELEHETNFVRPVEPIVVLTGLAFLYTCNHILELCHTFKFMKRHYML